VKLSVPDLSFSCVLSEVSTAGIVLVFCVLPETARHKFLAVDKKLVALDMTN